jgi:magnesium transporter
MDVSGIIVTDTMNLPKKLTTNIHPAQLADFLFRKNKRLELYLKLDNERRLELVRTITKPIRKELLSKLPEQEIVPLLENAGPDEATDWLQLLGKRRREKTLQLISQDLKNSLSVLLEFDPETAAGLMTLDYIQTDADDTVVEVAKKFRQHEKRTGRPPAILVLRDDKLVGYLPGHELGFATPNEQIGKYIKRIPWISYAATHDEVVHSFHSHPHNKVAVLNDAGSVLGIIYSDDVLKIMRERETASLYDFAGIQQEENVTDSTLRKVKNRYRWLIINLGTAFLAASTVGLFEDTIQKYVLLAIYMPIVAGMGGNAATQTLAVLVRGIALRQIRLGTAMKTLRNEVSAGFLNGIIDGLIVATIVLIVNHDFRLAIVLALAMPINLTVAGFFGTLVPLIMKRLGKDPAASATIFITTATDVLGFLAFLGLATLILR